MLCTLRVSKSAKSQRRASNKIDLADNERKERGLVLLSATERDTKSTENALCEELGNVLLMNVVKAFCFTLLECFVYEVVYKFLKNE